MIADSTAASTALFTDRYELTMLDAALASGVADHRAAFEVFARRLPRGRRFGVVAGIDRLVEALAAFRFGDAELELLEADGVVGPTTLEWLAGFASTADVTGYREGELYLPGSPVLTVEGTFGEAVLVETLVLSILNHDSAVASAAARMVSAADGTPLIEMGSRRTHEQAAVAAARAAYVAGFASTSNLEAGRRYGLPTVGTAAHAFTLAHRDECAAFTAQLAALGAATTLLVDTYDIADGIGHAVHAARALGAPGPGAVRLDSGDPLVEAVRARSLLDRLGASATRIVVTSDLDEYEIDRLQRAGAPIDGYGVGTRLVTGSGHPTAELVYKLVAIADRPGADAPLRPVAKRSVGKATVGGRKVAYRVLDPDGTARGERLVLVGAGRADAARAIRPPVPDGWTTRRLQVDLVRGGEPVVAGVPADRPRRRGTTVAARAHHEAVRAELPDEARALTDGPAAFIAELADTADAAPPPHRSHPHRPSSTPEVGTPTTHQGALP